MEPTAPHQKRKPDRHPQASAAYIPPRTWGNGLGHRLASSYLVKRVSPPKVTAKDFGNSGCRCAGHAFGGSRQGFGQAHHPVRGIIILIPWLRRSSGGWFGRSVLALDGEALRGRDLPGLNEGGPGLTRLWAVLGRLTWDRRYADKYLAGRALDLPAGESFVTLQVLLAMRTGEFEFAHNVIPVRAVLPCRPISLR
jgi:hypothetical protein